MRSRVVVGDIRPLGAVDMQHLGDRRKLLSEVLGSACGTGPDRGRQCRAGVAGAQAPHGLVDGHRQRGLSLQQRLGACGYLPLGQSLVGVDGLPALRASCESSRSRSRAT